MLKQRVITAIALLLALIAATTLLSAFVFALLLSVLLLIAAWEWNGFIGFGAADSSSKIAFTATIAISLLGLFLLLGITPQATILDELRVSLLLGLGLVFWVLMLFVLRGYPENKSTWNDKSKIASMGMLSLLSTWIGLVQLKYLMPNGYLVQSLFVLVAAVDVGAYFSGLNFGKRKLAPQLSPKKTWEGVWGGLLACMLVAAGLSWLYHNYYQPITELQFLLLLVLALIVTFFSVVGDLIESMLKRNQDVKDSGSILPGHGGLLDRVDGLMAATPVYVLWMHYIIRSAG